MAHPHDPGAPSVSSAPSEAGEWILARVLGDAIAAQADNIIATDGAEAYLDSEAAGAAAASALRFFTTSADFFDDDLLTGIPLFALAQSLPSEILDVGTPAPPATSAGDTEASIPSVSPAAPSKLELISAIRDELKRAMPGKPRRQRAFAASYLRPRGVMHLRQLSTVELQNMLTAVERITDTFRRGPQVSG